MKQLLLTTFFFFALLAHAAESDSSVKATFGGQGRFRYERSDQTDYLSLRSAFLLRVRPELRLSKGSDLSLFVQPQFSKAYGKPDFVGSSTTANASQTTSGTTYDTALGIHQAIIEYKPSDKLQMLFGRQVLSYGDEVVLSGLDWDNVGRSFDAIKTRYTHSMGNVDLFYGKLFAATTTATSLAPGDSDLLGLYSSNDFGTGLSATDLYLLYRRDQTIAVNKDLFAVGARIKSKLNSVDYRAELTKEGGSQFANAGEAYQADLEVGMNFESPFKSRLGIEYFRAGTHYDQLYPLAHKYLGIADVLGRRNIQGGTVHLSATPSEGFTTQLDLHYFIRSATDVPVYKLNGTTALGTGTDSSRGVGTELDLIFNYAFTKEFNGVLGGAVLFPGDYLKSYFGDKKPVFWYTQLTAQL